MAKISKLTRSQNAHMRLRQKAADMPGKRGDLVYTYHGEVIKRQKSAGRVLSKKERRGIFSPLKKWYLGGN